MGQMGQLAKSPMAEELTKQMIPNKMTEPTKKPSPQEGPQV